MCWPSIFPAKIKWCFVFIFVFLHAGKFRFLLVFLLTLAFLAVAILLHISRGDHREYFLIPSIFTLANINAFTGPWVTDGFGSGFARGDAGRDALGLQGVPEPVGVGASVAQQPLGPGQAVQQGGGAGVVAELACRHEQAGRASIRIAHSVELGVHAALGAFDQPPEAPFLPAGSKPYNARYAHRTGPTSSR